MSPTIKSVLLLLTAFLGLPAAAHTVFYETNLLGSNENPSNLSAGTGSVLVTVDLDLATMRIQASFSGLTGNTTAAHIHCCTTLSAATTAPHLLANVGAVVQTPNLGGFPTGVKAGSYDRTFNLTLASTYSAAFVTNNGGVGGAMNALLAAFDNQKAYFNIHTNTSPGGEIRGFLAPVPVPAAAWLFGSALVGMVGARRRLTA
jgi:CHRD domain